MAQRSERISHLFDFFLEFFVAFGLKRKKGHLIVVCVGKYQKEGGEPSVKL